MKRAALPFSMPDRLPPESGRGFTLVELLVVTGVIVVLGGALGFALGRRGSEGGAVVGAQRLVAGLINVTRAQAVLHQTNARLIVYAQPPPSGSTVNYLRRLQVVREEPFESESYVAVGGSVALPEPVCVVPSLAVPADHVNPGVVWLTEAAPVSTLASQSSFHYSGRAGAGAEWQFFGQANATGPILFIQFGPDGLVSDPVNGAKVALAAAVLDPAGVPKFNNRHGVRGILLRRSGSIALVDEPAGF
jgi:prepilin-type N-terminal cleavage/methylation domain-containing protein